MPAGTWNLGRLRKHVEYVGLKDLGVPIVDTTTSSDQYFNVVEFPTTLTGGKNLFKLKANANRLVRNSKLHVEVLDSNGKPIYYEPINYLEQDGTRVIAIYIYPDTPYGTATVYLAGRARVDLRGRTLRYSQDVNDRDYINFPNVIWSRTVSLAPERLNSSEIIFTKKPILNLTEIVQPYLQPVNLTNVATQSFGTGSYTITPKPTSVSTTAVYNMAQVSAKSAGVAVVQGMNTMGTPPSNYGSQIGLNAASLQISTKGSYSNASSVTTNIITATDESVFETDTSFFTTNMSTGDIITIRNPIITTNTNGALLDGNGLVLPNSQTQEGQQSALANQTYGLSGSYNFVINQVVNTKKAFVVLLTDPPGFRNPADANTGGKWQVELGANQGSQIIDSVEASANYTCSFTVPYVLQITEQSQSFAEIKIADIEPATGDVYKLKTFYKPGGAFGNFIDAGDTILEQVELFEDTGSYEAGAQDGAQYNRTGFFSSLADYNLYWTSSQGSIAPTNALSETFEPDDLMSGIRLQAAGTYGTDGFSYIKLKDEYRPNLTRDTQYILTINSFADLSTTSTDPTVVNKPQLDIYVSASSGIIQSDNLTIDSYLSTPAGTYENSLQGIFADGGKFGTRIGSIQLNASSSLTPGIFRFNSAADVTPAEIYLVQRNGRYNVGNISLKTFNESKFTPNFTRINTRIPTQFLQTPLTFKIVFFDYQNRQAETEALIYPVVFTGENTVIGGQNNLLSGSVFIGNSVGSGIELAGVNSAFIRSVGYEGFKSASRTDKPGGFMIYTGSVLPSAVDDYNGAGLEIVEDSGSYFRFSTGTDPGLEIRTPKFYLGDDSNSISGSNGNIKISGSNVSINTPTFFLGDGDAQISGSNGNIKISGSNLEMVAETFYLGGTGQFVSGANGNIEISSSDFHLNRTGQVIMQGTITATAGGTIGGWAIGSTDLSAGSSGTYALIDAANSRLQFGAKGSLTDSNAGVHVGTDGIALGASSALVIKSSGQITGSTVKFTGGLIGGFLLSADQINDSTNALILKTNGQISGSNVLFDGGVIGGFDIGDAMISSSTGDLILRTDGDISGSQVFFTGGTVGGFSIDATKITGTNIVIDSAGSIQTSDYASDLKGWKLSAAANGFLEVENAKIRGTLSTAVFEKETVNAVGGQLYVANSTTLTSSSLHISENYTKTDATMSVVNVTGFAVGEILSAKKVSSTGFGTEYMRVQSASRNDASSENDFSGNVYVIRGYSGSAASGQATASLGGIAGAAQSYSGSQVIVSTGKVGTGFIRLNANPNDQATPYMDIVERTGSSIYDVQLKARLGDLSGLANSSYVFGNSEPGFGLATDNVFLQGGIIANTGSIGGIKMHEGKLFSGMGDGEFTSSDTGFYLDSNSKFSLGDKLSWNGSSLIVKGQIQLSDGTEVGNGMNWTGSWDASNNYIISDAVSHGGASYIASAAGINHEPPNSSYWDALAESGSDGIIGSNAETLILTTDSNVFAFASASSNVALDTSILISVSTQNLVNAIDQTNITVTGADTTNITGLAFSSASNGTGIISASLSFTAGTGAGGLNSDKDKLPLTITATSASLSDTTTIHKIQGGTGGLDGDPGTNGATANFISLEASTLVFVKALDGTITPATASLTASLQNMSPATASYTSLPVVTLLTGSQANFRELTHMQLTRDNFGTNTSVKITASSGSNHSDSITFVLLDEGSGNIQSVLGNSVHTFQAATNGTVNSFVGGGTSLNVYEGATELTYTASITQPAGRFSASIVGIKVTPGAFTGDGTSTATLGIPTGMSEASGAIHYTVQGRTQNNTPFTSSLTQSFAKSLAGAVGDTGASAKGVIVNGSTLIFTKDIAGIITPVTASFTASLSNATDDGTWSTTTGTVTGPNSGAVLNSFTGPPKCIVTRDNFVDGMIVKYKMASDDDDHADAVTLKLLDAGSGNTQVILGNQTHTFQANHTGSVTNFTGGGTTIQVFEGATELAHIDGIITSASMDISSSFGWYSASINTVNMTAGAISTVGNIYEYDNITNQPNAGSKWNLSAVAYSANVMSVTPLQQNFHTAVNLLINFKDEGGINQSAFYNSVNVGDSFVMWVSSNRWYEYKIITIDPNNPKGSSENIKYHYEIQYIKQHLTVADDSIDTVSGNPVYFQWKKSLHASLAEPTAMSAGTGEIHLTITGSSQNGTSFFLPTTQSFAKSLAGAEPITVIQTNETHTFVGDLTGTPASYVGSGNTIAVFEGISPLQGTVTSPGFGEFRVSGSGVNIVTGSNTVNGTDIVIGNLKDASETSGSIKNTILGKTLGGTEFTQSKSQTFSVTTQPSDAKSLILTTDTNVYAFASASSAVALDPTILISVSTQNLADTIDNTDIVVTKATGGTITGLAFSSASNGGTSVISASLSFTAAEDAGGLNNNKLSLPLSITTEIDSLSDSTTIHRIEGGTAGSDSKIVQLTANDYVIVYAADGTTPSPASTITLSGSSQNFTDAYFKFTGDGITDESSYSDGTHPNQDHFSFTVPSSHFSTPKTLKVSVQEGSSGGEVAFDTLTISAVKPGATGDNGTDAKLLSLEASSLVFVKALDGTITPATASITASLQNTTSPTASYTSVPVVTLLTGSQANFRELTHMQLTKDNFGTNTSVRVNVSGENGAVSDSISFVLLDEGSGNVQAILGNSAHILQSPSSGVVSNFVGAGTSLNVYEGATLLTYDKSNKEGSIQAGEFSASISQVNITAGTFAGDDTTTATLSVPTAMSDTAASGSIHFSITGSTQNGTPFFLPLTQSFAKSIAGTTGANAKSVIVTSDAAFFVKAIDGTYTPSEINISGSGQNLTEFGSFSESEGLLTSEVTSGNSNKNKNTAKITSDNFVDGMVVTFTSHTDDGLISDSVTIKELDVGAGNTQVILGNQAHIFQADYTGSVYDFSGGGTTLQVFEGATALTYTASITGQPSGFYSASFVSNNMTPGALTGNVIAHSGSVGTFADPTAITANTAELRIEISGSTQNGTIFFLPVTQSFAKSIAGSEPITIIQTNPAHSFVGDLSGIVVASGYPGSGNDIFVYEGAAELEGTDDNTYNGLSAANKKGKFKVTAAGTNITAGGDSDATSPFIRIGISSNALQSSGSVLYTIVGKSIGGNDFTRTATQAFTTTTQALNAKTVVVSPDKYFFTKDIAGNYSPAVITISGSGQNLTGDGNPGWESSAGTLTDKVVSTNSNHCKITSANFVDGMVVTFTANSADENISDSVTISELDAGSGNVQTMISNETHTFQADYLGYVPIFDGDSSVYVYEGITKLSFSSSLASSSLGLSASFYTNASPNFNWRLAPSGSAVQASGYSNYSDNLVPNASPTSDYIDSKEENAIDFGIGPFGETELLWEIWPDDANGNDGGFNSTNYEIDSGSAYMFVFYSKKHSPHDSGSCFIGWKNGHTSGTNQNSSFTTFGKENGQISTGKNPYFINAGNQPYLPADHDKWYMHVGMVYESGSGDLTYKYKGGNYNLETKELAVAMPFVYAFTSQSTHTMHRFYHFNNDDVSPSYGEKVASIALPAVYKVDGTEPSLDMLLAGHRIDNDTELGKRADIRIHGFSGSNSAQLILTTTGSTQNGTAFDQQSNILSYNKSLSGTEPIVATQTNQSFTLVGNTSGIPANYIGSDNIINVFEGTSSLVASTNADTSTGQFFVSASGIDVAPGSIADSGLNIVIGVHGSATTQSGSISYQVTGRTLANTEFTRSLSQQFSITTAASDAKLITLASSGQVFVKDVTGAISPAFLSFTASLQNTIDSDAVFTNNGSATVTGGINANHKRIANTEVTVGTPLTITATAASDSINDAMTIHLLDEGSGNVLASLGNSNHTFQATTDGTVPSFAGGGTTLQVFEGATVLSYSANSAHQTIAGRYTASISQDNVTAGTFSGLTGNVGAQLSIPTAMSANIGAIHIKVHGHTQNNTPFTSSLTQSFAKSLSGAQGNVGPSFPFLSSAINAIDTSGNLAAGLIMTPTVLGFHGAISAGDGTNAQASDFTSYLDNAGNFYLGKKSATPKAYLAWDNTDGSEALLISGSNANITVDKFFLGNHAQYISGSSGNIEISSSFFHLTADGQITGSNVKFSGGVIGGIEIGNDTIGAGTAWAISGSTYLADPIGFISSSAFKVSAGGAVTASTMLLTGAGIRIPSGTFGVIESTNWGASAGAQLDLNGDELTFGGYTCPTFHVAQDGQVTHGGLVERTITVNAGNASLYYSASITVAAFGETPAVTHTTLVMDGSQGGCVFNNAVINLAPPSTNGLKGIKTFAHSDRSSADLFIKCAGVTFDDGQVDSGTTAFLQKY